MRQQAPTTHNKPARAGGAGVPCTSSFARKARAHVEFAEEICRWLNDRGVVSARTGAEDLYPQSVLEILWRTTSIDALALRSSPDALAVVEKSGVVFDYEAKTSDGPNVALEAWPLAMARTIFDTYRDLARPLVIAVKDIRRGIEFGLLWHRDFSADPLGEIVTEVRIPERWSDAEFEDFARIFGAAFGHWVEMKRVPNTAGSNDPYILIDRAWTERQNHWQEVMRWIIE